MFTIRRYTTADRHVWDEFVARSKNGTFLFLRDYMDYHSDRFDDFSLMFYNEKDELYGLLPANRKNGTLYSHQGLSYGGLVMSDACTAARVCQLFAELNAYLRGQGFAEVVYKPVPHIYHTIPSEEDLYALPLVCHARLTGRDVSSTIVPQRPVKWKRDRHYASNKARTNGVTVAESDDFPAFWEILTDNLRTKFNASPVHSLEEIELLRSRFPENIRLWTASSPEGRMLAGTVLYLNRDVMHAQYISASEEGKRLHAVDALYDDIIHRSFAGYRLIDLGTSNMPHSSDLHESLIYQKEGFGGRAVCCDTYEWKIEPEHE